jgi:predicted transposase/invertase (TIGR01784 family)
MAMEQAIRAYHQITEDSEFREMERLREKARHDEASALRHARDEGRAEGRAEGHAEGRTESRVENTLEIARKMKNAGRPLNEITEFTGLPAKTIEQM